MTLKHLIEIGDVKEKQSLALTGILADKDVDIEKLQLEVDTYCDNLASSFIAKYKSELQYKELLLGLRKHIISIKADKPHSGYRFYEALYKKLKDYEKIIESNQAEQTL